MSENFSPNFAELGLAQPESNDLIEKQQTQMLHEIQSAIPQAEWSVEIPEKQYGIIIRMPHDCWISATLIYFSESHQDAALYIDMFTVNEQVQGKGIGTRLMQSLIGEAKKYRATQLRGHVSSLSALKTRARIFGKDNLEFYSHVTKEPLSLSFDEALIMAETEIPNYDVHVNLNEIDTSGWEEVVS